MSKLLLFDFDGVIVDSLSVYERTVKSCLEKIGHPIVQSREDFLDLFEDNFYEGIVKRGVDLQEFVAASKDIQDEIHYEDLEPHRFLFPVLESLYRDHVLAIISSNTSDIIRRALDAYQIDGYFEEILGSDTAYGKGEKINLAMYLFGVAQNRICYIGDTAGDIREARQAGVRAVGVTWGWHSPERLMAAHPDFMAERPEDLFTYLESMVDELSDFYIR
ncbi:MAG: HAD family hydrolase [Syntrophales bacterium]|jgi:phosphoglycolate phosphatase|nr:HAD family hydrolase [Syntrophales bacterium]